MLTDYNILFDRGIEKVIPNFYVTVSSLVAITTLYEWFAKNFSFYEMEKLELVDPGFIKYLDEKVLLVNQLMKQVK